MEAFNNFSEVFLSVWNKGILGVDIFQILKVNIEFPIYRSTQIVDFVGKILIYWVPQTFWRDSLSVGRCYKANL